MGTISTRKLTDGTLRFRAEIRINRKDFPEYKESKTFATRRIAENWIKKREDEIRTNPEILMGKQNTGQLKIYEAINKYLDEVGSNFSKTKNNTLKLLLKFPISKLQVSKLNSSDIANHVALRRNGIPKLNFGSVTPSTIRNEVTLLRGVLEHASIMWGVEFNSNEFDRTTAQLRKTRQISASNKRDRMPTKQELSRLILYFYGKWKDRGNSRYPMHLVILFAIFSCRRESEITRLLISDYDDVHNFFHVRDLKNPSGSKGNNKDFMVLGPCKKLIEIFKREDVRRRMLECGFSKDLLVPLRPKTIASEFHWACKLLGIDDLRFHDLRHEGCTRLAEQGFTIPQIQQVSLHESWNSLQRYVSVKKRVNVITADELLSIIDEA